MTNSDDLKPLYHRPSSGIKQPTREQLIASPPPEHRSQLMHNHISELFNEKYMTNWLLRHAVDAGIQQNLSEVDSLKNLVVLLLDEREEAWNKELKRAQESVTTPIFKGQGWRPEPNLFPELKPDLTPPAQPPKDY